MSESLVPVSVQLPAGSVGLAQGLSKLVLAIVAAHKAGGGALVEASADVLAAVAALPAALSSVGALGEEAKIDPIGLAEAFALAGCETARSLLAPPSA